MLFRAAVRHRPVLRTAEAMSQPENGDNHRNEAPAGITSHELDAVYRIEAPRLTRLLRRKIWAEEERQDIVQEAFTRLAEAKSGAAAANPGAYLQGIVRHLLADRVRRWRKRQSLGADDLQTSPEPLAPDTALEIDELRIRYRSAVDALPPKTREVYWLHRVEDLQYKQIAEKCGISVRTVEWHIAQAIMRISKSLSADG